MAAIDNTSVFIIIIYWTLRTFPTERSFLHGSKNGASPSFPPPARTRVASCLRPGAFLRPCKYLSLCVPLLTNSATSRIALQTTPPLRSLAARQSPGRPIKKSDSEFLSPICKYVAFLLLSAITLSKYQRRLFCSSS